MKNTATRPIGAFTVDVEDWFHILDSPVAPDVEQWGSLESRIDKSMGSILKLLRDQNVHATFFWLGWVAERHRNLLVSCMEAGHEIASHGYAHVLAHQVGPDKFREDIHRGKSILEDITGREVKGFRAAGFGITDKSRWAFDEIKAAGYTYDSSIFPLVHGHGGIQESQLGSYKIDTSHGQLVEFPMSAIEVFGRRLSMFGGGYLRLFPWPVIRAGISRLHNSGHPVIIYIHPREVDSGHPRLRLTPFRRFKCYVGLKSTYPKLVKACRAVEFFTMEELVNRYF